jgi:cytochrome c oxidase subunit 2
MENYQIKLPPQGIQVAANKFVEFTASSKDVTYGFGVFRADGKMVFQMQVLPGRENKILWKFDAPGAYDIRSTEYSGPKHPEMFVKNAIRVTQ